MTNNFLKKDKVSEIKGHSMLETDSKTEQKVFSMVFRKDSQD